jgi:SAM-dependent methyltransferase
MEFSRFAGRAALFCSTCGGDQALEKVDVSVTHSNGDPKLPGLHLCRLPLSEVTVKPRCLTASGAFSRPDPLPDLVHKGDLTKLAFVLSCGGDIFHLRMTSMFGSDQDMVAETVFKAVENCETAVSVYPNIFSEGPRGFRVLDVGCGFGLQGLLYRANASPGKWHSSQGEALLEKRNQNAWEVKHRLDRTKWNTEFHGIEGNLEHKGKNPVHETFYTKVHYGDAITLMTGMSAVEGGDYYDVVLCSDMLEHLPRQAALDAVALMEKLATHYVVLVVPCTLFFASHDPDVPLEQHVTQFTQQFFLERGYNLAWTTLDSFCVIKSTNAEYLSRINKLDFIDGSFSLEKIAEVLREHGMPVPPSFGVGAGKDVVPAEKAPPQKKVMYVDAGKKPSKQALKNLTTAVKKSNPSEDKAEATQVKIKKAAVPKTSKAKPVKPAATPTKAKAKKGSK